ncbi:hypothetical protein T08_111, partial [Trichinella sp. T8]
MFCRTKNRFLTLHYANKDRYNAALSSVRVRLFKEWSKENVKTRTARSRTREGNSRAKDTSEGIRDI